MRFWGWWKKTGSKGLRNTDLSKLLYLEGKCRHLKSRLFTRTLNSTRAQENHPWPMTSAWEEREYPKLQITNKERSERCIPRAPTTRHCKLGKSVGKRKLKISRKRVRRHGRLSCSIDKKHSQEEQVLILKWNVHSTVREKVLESEQNWK